MAGNWKVGALSDRAGIRPSHRPAKTLLNIYDREHKRGWKAACNNNWKCSRAVISAPAEFNIYYCRVVVD